MTNVSSISINAGVALMVLFGVLFIYQSTARQPVNLIHAQSGEARQLPMEFLRLRPTMW